MAEEDSNPPEREGHTEYTRGTLSEADLKKDPFAQFADWLEAAVVSAGDEPTTMTLATSTLDGVPSARIVLIDEYGPEGFTFYTNYESRKGRELADNPRAAAVFFWPHLERQVRIEGVIEKLSAEASDAYHGRRAYKSQLAAWASQQSKRIESRKALEDRMEALQAQYTPGNVPRPPHWGGYRLIPRTFEFWQGRAHRLNDRILYEIEATGRWQSCRLAP